MICYHVTDAADAILREGFRDETGSYMFANLILTGVWIADQPLNCNEGAKGDQVLQVAFADDFSLESYEIVEEEPMNAYREWCVPAALINTHAAVTLLSEEEVEELEDRRFRARFPDGPPDWLRPLNGPEGDAD
jgi:hypothetical protein